MDVESAGWEAQDRDANGWKAKDWESNGCGAGLVGTAMGGANSRGFRTGGGFVVAVIAVRNGGLPQGCWWRAWLCGAALQQLTRVVTEPSRNINAAFAVYERFSSLLGSYAAYLASLGLIAAVCLWSSELLIRRYYSVMNAEFWSEGARS